MLKNMLKISLAFLCFLCHTQIFANPSGYSINLESDYEAFGTAHNGNYIYFQKNRPDHVLRISIADDEVAYYFDDGSNLILNATTQVIRQVGFLNPLGRRSSSTYHISALGSNPSWKLRADNRVLWEQFLSFSEGMDPYNTREQLIASAVDDPVKPINIYPNFSPTPPNSEQCAAEKDDAEHGYQGYKTLSECHADQDAALMVAVVLDALACFTPGANFVTCAPLLANHGFQIQAKKSKVSQCIRAKEVAVRDLNICKSENDGSGAGASDPGGNGMIVNNGMDEVPASKMICAEWVEIKNSTIGDFSYCSRYRMQP